MFSFLRSFFLFTLLTMGALKRPNTRVIQASQLPSVLIQNKQQISRLVGGLFLPACFFVLACKALNENLVGPLVSENLQKKEADRFPKADSDYFLYKSGNISVVLLLLYSAWSLFLSFFLGKKFISIYVNTYTFWGLFCLLIILGLHFLFESLVHIRYIVSPKSEPTTGKKESKSFWKRIARFIVSLLFLAYIGFIIHTFVTRILRNTQQRVPSKQGPYAADPILKPTQR